MQGWAEQVVWAEEARDGWVVASESSEQRFLGGMGSIFRAPVTAAEPPEKRKMPVRNASFMSEYCH